MKNTVQILIVEDEMIIAANLSLQLTKFGYEVSGIIPRAEEALLQIKQHQPDLLLVDINLKGELDGIEMVELMQQDLNIPVIYLTANSDDAHFNRAKITNPYAFISKPVNLSEFQRVLELTCSQIQSHTQSENDTSLNNGFPTILNDCIFVRHQDKMVKVDIKAIYYIEAERNYCRIFTKEKEYLLVMTLKEMDQKLPNQHFIRVHRSFIVNLSHIIEVAKSHIVISNKAIPVSKILRDELLKRLQTI